MWTLFLVFALMPVLVFIEIAAQKWLFKNVTEKHDLEWEIYRRRYD